MALKEFPLLSLLLLSQQVPLTLTAPKTFHRPSIQSNDLALIIESITLVLYFSVTLAGASSKWAIMLGQMVFCVWFFTCSLPAAITCFLRENRIEEELREVACSPQVVRHQPTLEIPSSTL